MLRICERPIDRVQIGDLALLRDVIGTSFTYAYTCGGERRARVRTTGINAYDDDDADDAPVEGPYFRNKATIYFGQRYAPFRDVRIYARAFRKSLRDSISLNR